MELPQSRPFGTEGKKPTHDFLSLYSHSTVQLDPRPPSQGGYLKTHDFLQVGKTNAKEANTVEISSTVEKPPHPATPPSSTSVEHVLPGGIGTYSISHMSYFDQKVTETEGAVFTVAQASSTEKNDENSNCSSYTGSGFSLWEESAVKKGKTGKENEGERPDILREATVKVGHWASQSSSNNNHSHRNSFTSLSSSQVSGLKSQSFIDMIKSAKGGTIDEDFDDEEEFVLKKENFTTTAHKGVKVVGKSNDQKPNTPRSKHSATEQRRRSKINDRFQMLRELIPRGDQKRDKASFLLEVIEYIQFLQQKVHNYEGPYLGWNQEPTKLVPWRNNQKPAESYVDQSCGKNNGSGPALVFAAKLDEKKVPISPAIPGNARNPVESDVSTATKFKTMDHQPGLTYKPMPFPLSLQPNCYNRVRNGSPRLASDADNINSQPQAQLCNTRLCTSDAAAANYKLKEQELTVEGGTINISTVYSHGLLNSLTQALQSSGVDLSQASVSVQIDLGKRATGGPIAPASILKDNEVASSNQATTRPRIGNCEDSDQALKKQRTDKS